MRFVIPTQKLSNLVSKCHCLIPIKTTIPILANVLLEASGNELSITSSDLVVGLRCRTEVEVLEEGSTTLSAKYFMCLLRELTAATVEVHTRSTELTEVIANSSRFKLPGMSRSEFPSLPDMTGAVQIKIPQAEFKEALYRSAFAVSREDNRYVLTGLNMFIANGAAIFAGTDGKCLARAILPLAIDSQLTGNYNIPLKAVEEIQKNLGDEGDITLHLLSDKIAVETAETFLVAKLLAGNYPDINQVIPQKPTINVPLHREELTALLRQVALFTEDKCHSARFAFTPGELHLSANSAKIGEGRVSMPVNYQGKKMEIAFNPNLFLEILRHNTEEVLNLGITDSFNPGLITGGKPSEHPASAQHLAVLMPMRLSEQ